MKYKTIEEKIDAVYDDLFDFVCDRDDDFYELKVVYKGSDGKTIEKSWLKRNKRLESQQ